MSNKIEISKVLLRIGKKEIKLSLEEARELQQILADMLGIMTSETTVYPPSPTPVAIPYYPREYRWWEVMGKGSDYVVACSNQLGVNSE